MDSPSPLIVILGPTASGKTRLAVELAKRFDGVIISADSRQIYRHMDVGTGKDLNEYGTVPYHLIDIVEPGTPYNVSQYRQDASAAIRHTLQAGKRPILCGGTGLYIQTLLQGLPYSDVPVNEALREALEYLPTPELTARLSQLPLPANYTPDTSTRKRIIRALEVAAWYEQNPQGIADTPPLNARVFGIAVSLEERRQRITARLKQRLQHGLIEEVQGLLDRGLTPEQLIRYGLEYKYVTAYLLGELDYPTLFARLNTEIHRYAKRQMTYFRKMEKDGIMIQWVAPSDIPKLSQQLTAE